MKNYEKPIAEIIDLSPLQSIMDGTAGDGPGSMDQGVTDTIPGVP